MNNLYIIYIYIYLYVYIISSGTLFSYSVKSVTGLDFAVT